MDDVTTRGNLRRQIEVDFWVFPKGLLDNMPPLAVGRPSVECWSLFQARKLKADLIDATETMISVHQNHDYTHHPQGIAGYGTGVEAQRNRELVGGRPYFFSLKDRTHVLNSAGLERVRDPWTIWRAFRTSQVLNPSMPLPTKLASWTLNNAVDGCIDILKGIRDLRSLRPLRRRC